MDLESLLSLTKEHGLTLVLLFYFIYQYIKSKDDTINLIISVKDETNKNTLETTKAINAVKDELADIIRDEVRNIEEKVGRIEMLLIVKGRGEEK